jgi:ABC-type sugar transport system substrate-binding protein
MVRSALSQGLSVLMIEPQDPSALAPVLAQARDQGLPVVLLNHDVPVAGKPLTLITYASIDPAVQSMVETALKASFAFNASAEGPVRMLISRDRDANQPPPRIVTLKRAIEAAGLKLLPDLPVGPSDDAAAILKNQLTAKPRPTILFGENDFTLTSVNRVTYMTEGADELPIMAGFVGESDNLANLRMPGLAAVVYLNYAGFAQKAVATAVALARGQKVPERIEVPVEARQGRIGMRRPMMNRQSTFQ